MFEELIQKIEAHASYGPAMKEAVARQAPLVLNYHTHGPGTGYCVSICTRDSSVLPVMGQAVPLDELVHVKGIGQSEDQCEPLMSALGQELEAHYVLGGLPVIYLDGVPTVTKS